MIKCPFCGNETEEGAAVCPHCNASLPENGGSDVQNAIRAADKKNIAPAVTVKNKKNTKIIIAAIAAAVVVALIFVSLHGAKGKTAPKDLPVSDTTDHSLSEIATMTGTGNDPDDAISSVAVTGDMPTTGTAQEATAAAVGSQQTAAPTQNSAGSQQGNSDNQQNSSGNQQNHSGGSQQSVLTTTPVPTSYDTFVYFVNTVNSGSYSITGSMISSDGSSMPMGMSFSGSDLRMSAEMEGISLDMAAIDGTLYLINNENKTYMTLTESLAEKLDLSVDDLDLESAKWQFPDPSNAKKETATLNGATVDCFVLNTEAGTVKVYVSGSDIKRFDKEDNDGKDSVQYNIDSFRGNITKEDLLPGSDYKSKNYFSFLTSLM